jgi:hypothetical protein
MPVMKTLVKQLIDDFTEPGHPYDADDFGYLVLIEPGDVDRVLTDLDMPWTLADVPWEGEGASMRGNFYYAVYLGTDDYGNHWRHIMMTQTSLNLVTRELVPEDQRMAVAERLFGIHFPLKLEPVIYGITDRMAEDYTGGYWDYWMLSHGGFYMAPSGDTVYHVTCDNMFEGEGSG